MIHTEELTSQSKLANELGLTDRRVRQLEDQGVIVRNCDGRYDVGLNHSRYRLFIDRDIDRVATAVEEAAKRSDDALDQIRTEPSLKKRRVLAQKLGSAIGQLELEMKLANALAPEHHRQLSDSLTCMIVGRAVDELLELCNWQIAHKQ